MELQLQTKDPLAALHLDPRTKMYLLIVGNVALFLAPSLLYEIALVVCVVILGILVGAKRFTTKMAVVYAGMVILHIIGTNYLTGTLQIAIVTFTVFIRKIFPCAMLGGILVSTTRVNEFMAAMNRIHMPKAMIIPMTVMLRYFPMVHEDWGYISDAMHIQIVTDHNNFHEIETTVFFKWMFKSACAILIVTNTWTIVMGIFDAAQSVVAQAVGVVVSDATVDISTMMDGLEERLMEMDLGALFGLWFQSLFVHVTAWAVAICIFIVIYGSMLEVYLTASIAPIPMATMMGKEFGGMGQNYLRSLLALAFQAFLIIVCVAIYAVLVQNIALDEDVSKAIWTCMGYTVLLCFTLFKTSSMARSIFAAH